MQAPVEPDERDVASQPGRPACDVLHVEHGVGQGRRVLPGGATEAAGGAGDQDRGLDLQPRPKSPLRPLDRGQPAHTDRESLDRLPGQVVRPLAAVVGVQALAVDVGQIERDDPVRRRAAEPTHRGGQRSPYQPGGVEVEERAVEEEPVDAGGVTARVCPERGDQATRRVGADQQRVVTVLLPDDSCRFVEFGEVVGDVVAEVRGLVGEQAPPVLA